MKNTKKLLLLLSCGMLLAACGGNDASSHATGLTSESSHATGLTSESSHATGLTSESSHATGLTSEESHDTGLTSEDSHDTGFTSEDSHDTGLTSESSSAVEPSKPYHTWQVVGSVDELGKWGFDNALNFVYDAALDAHVVSEVTLYKGTEFKFVRDKTWSGDNEVVDAIIAALNDAAVVGKSGNNVLVKTSGKFSFKILDKDAAITADDLAITFEEVVDPVVKPAHHWAVIGGFNNWNVNDTTLAFTYDEVTDVHTFTGSIPVNTKFKILADKTWGAMNELGWQVVSALNDTSILHEVGDDRGAEFLKAGTVTITIKDTIDPTSSESYKDITVDFKEAPAARPYHSWKVVGSTDALGNWNLSSALSLAYDADKVSHSLSFDANVGDMFKLVGDDSWADANVLDAELVDALNNTDVLALSNDEYNNPTVKKNVTFTITISDDFFDLEDKSAGLSVSFVERTVTNVWSVSEFTLNTATGESGTDVFLDIKVAFEGYTEDAFRALAWKIDFEGNGNYPNGWSGLVFKEFDLGSKWAITDNVASYSVKLNGLVYGGYTIHFGVGGSDKAPDYKPATFTNSEKTVNGDKYELVCYPDAGNDGKKFWGCVGLIISDTATATQTSARVTLYEGKPTLQLGGTTEGGTPEKFSYDIQVNGGSWATTKMASTTFVEEGNWSLNGDVSGVANGAYIVHWFLSGASHDLAKVADADLTSVSYQGKTYSLKNVGAGWDASVIITALVVENAEN